MTTIPDEVLYGDHLEDIERLLILGWKLQGRELEVVSNIVKAKSRFLLSCSPNEPESMVMESFTFLVAIRSKMKYQIDTACDSDLGVGSKVVDPVIVRLINCKYAVNESVVDLLTSAERLSGVRMQIPGNWELPTAIRKAVEPKIDT